MPSCQLLNHINLIQIPSNRTSLPCLQEEPSFTTRHPPATQQPLHQPTHSRNVLPPHNHHAPNHRRLHPRLGRVESRARHGRPSPRLHNKPVPNLAPNPRQGQRCFPKVVRRGRRPVVKLQGKVESVWEEVKTKNASNYCKANTTTHQFLR